MLGGDASHCMLAGGSRSGKTFEIVRSIVMRAIAAPRSRHATFRQHFNSVVSSIVLDTFPRVMELCFPGVDYEIKQTPHCYARFQGDSEYWFGGLDDKARTEKVLGQEYATVHLNECSQISYQSRNVAVTRLAQQVLFTPPGASGPRGLRLRAFYDENPPSKAYWTYKLFCLKRDPESGQPLQHPEDYAVLFMNPGDNRANLPAEYIKSLEQLPPRMRARFLEGVYGDVAEGALWTLEAIERNRTFDQLPDMQRIVVAVDPSGTAGDETQSADPVGIVVVGLGTDGRGYVLEDLTLNAGPQQWATVAVSAFHRWKADLIVAERNFGGEMVRYTIQSVDENVPVKVVTASRGKAIRAEPIASLNNRGKTMFAGRFSRLEDELCAFTSRGYTGDRSPNRADAYVWGMSELFPGMVAEGPENRFDVSRWKPSPIGIG
jgi:hypothetical protein